MKNNSPSISRYIALYSIIVVLIFLASFLPYVFLVPLLFVAVSFGLGTTLFASLAFGIISFLLSFAGGATFVPLVFIEYPIIPIVPRILAGLAAFYTHFLLSRLIKKEGKLKTYLPKAIAAAVGSLANTFFVVLFMYIFIPSGKIYGEVSLDAFVYAIAIPSSAIETVLTTLIVPPLAVAVCRALRLTKFREMLTDYISKKPCSESAQ